MDMNIIFFFLFLGWFIITYIEPVSKSFTPEDFKKLSYQDYISTIRTTMILAGAISLMIGFFAYPIITN